MIRTLSLLAAAGLAAVAVFALTGSPAAAQGAQPDPLRAALAESKATGKGLTFYVRGATVPGAVISFDDRYVVARNQAQGTVVIRVESIDAVAGAISAPK